MQSRIVGCLIRFLPFIFYIKSTFCPSLHILAFAIGLGGGSLIVLIFASFKCLLLVVLPRRFFHYYRRGDMPKHTRKTAIIERNALFPVFWDPFTCLRRFCRKRYAARGALDLFHHYVTPFDIQCFPSQRCSLRLARCAAVGKV